MKILISTDIEGISGIKLREKLFDKIELLKLKKLLTLQVNEIIKVCFENAATKVIVTDGHGGGENIISERLDPRAELINQKKGIYGMLEGVDQVEYCIFFGYHGRAGNLNSFCSHTNNGRLIKKVSIGSKEVGEGEINMLLAKSFKVPLLLLIGTDFAIKEIKELLPDIETLELVKSIDRNRGESLELNEAITKIKEKTKIAIKNKGTFSVFNENQPWRVVLFDNSRIEIDFGDIRENYLKYREELKKLARSNSS